eukprot:6203763-Pleurochrysis_carterae.AAC.2
MGAHCISLLGLLHIGAGRSWMKRALHQGGRKGKKGTTQNAFPRDDHLVSVCTMKAAGETSESYRQTARLSYFGFADGEWHACRAAMQCHRPSTGYSSR